MSGLGSWGELDPRLAAAQQHLEQAAATMRQVAADVGDSSFHEPLKEWASQVAGQAAALTSAVDDGRAVTRTADATGWAAREEYPGATDITT